tara:strand:- start:201 stop:1571 length:1371 start_codon:yes stop_codon:yes gene_type:complete
MTFWSAIVKRFKAPSLPKPTQDYDRAYMDGLVNILRLYFNQLDNLLGQIVATTGSPVPISIGGTNVDAFGRVRVSQPYTLFDSQNRYAIDNQFDTRTATGGSTTYLPNEASVRMDVTTSSGSEVVRQSYRCMPYQPGKGLLVLETFVMNSPKTGLRQRAGYFGTQNGVFIQQNDSTVSFVLRSYISGSVSDVRTVNQADWNGDKLNGTGDSGYTLDLTKAQILWMDFEWLGVGSVRCGFIIDGQYIVCHTFENANDITSVYMTTAILPVRYEITNTAATASASSLKQICSSVVSEGGYEQTSIEHVARRTATLTGIGTTFVPLVSIRLASTALNAVVLPAQFNVMPTSTGDDFEVVLAKNCTGLTSASWAAVASDANVEMDTSATAMTLGTIVDIQYVKASNQSSGTINQPAGYNWDLQLGSSLTGTSDIYTLGIRVLSGSSGAAIGSLTFYDLTQ